jgi:hypothetical protein
VGAILRAVRDQILSNFPVGPAREGVEAALRIIFTTLRERGDQVVWFGIAVALVAYLVGPGRLPRALRRGVVTGSRTVWSWGRDLTTGTQSSSWVRERLDGMRIAGVVVAGVIALLLSSWTSLLVVLVLLGAYELAITFIARPTAEAVEGEPAGPEAGPEAEAPLVTTEEKPMARAGGGGSGTASGS